MSAPAPETQNDDEAHAVESLLRRRSDHSTSSLEGLTMNAREDSQFPLNVKAPGGIVVPAEFAEISQICTATEIEIGGRTVFGIADARDLYAGLKVGRDYTTWLKGRIAEYGFREGADYEMFDPPDRGNQSGRGGDRRSQVYRLTLPMAKELAMVENNDQGRLVRRYFIWLEDQVSRPVALPTTAEAFAHAFRMLADNERVRAEQSKAIARIEEKVERVETAQTILKTRPANAEAITHIRKRIGLRYGLSTDTVDQVMRQCPYAPKPAGVVKNEHENADGSTYAVYWQKDVTMTFDRFVGECAQVTPSMFTHPFIKGRFRCSGKGGTA